MLLNGIIKSLFNDAGERGLKIKSLLCKVVNSMDLNVVSIAIITKKFVRDITDFLSKILNHLT